MTASASEPSQPGFCELGPALHVLPRDRGASTSLRPVLGPALPWRHNRPGPLGFGVFFCRRMVLMMKMVVKEKDKVKVTNMMNMAVVMMMI